MTKKTCRRLLPLLFALVLLLTLAVPAFGAELPEESPAPLADAASIRVLPLGLPAAPSR